MTYDAAPDRYDRMTYCFTGHCGLKRMSMSRCLGVCVAVVMCVSLLASCQSDQGDGGAGCVPYLKFRATKYEALPTQGKIPTGRGLVTVPVPTCSDGLDGDDTAAGEFELLTVSGVPVEVAVVSTPHQPYLGEVLWLSVDKSVSDFPRAVRDTVRVGN